MGNSIIIYWFSIKVFYSINLLCSYLIKSIKNLIKNKVIKRSMQYQKFDEFY